MDAPLYRTTEKATKTARSFTFGALGLGAIAAVAGVIPSALFVSTPLLLIAGGLIALAAWIAGTRIEEAPVAKEDGDAKFARDIVSFAYAMGLRLVILLLLLVEVLTIPATLGHLKFFGSFVLAIVNLFPAILFALLGLVAGALLRHLRGTRAGALPSTKKVFALAGLGILAAFGLAALATEAGLLGVKPERAPFVLAGGVVGLSLFATAWTRMPDYGDVMRWLESEERIRSTKLLANVVHTFLVLSGLGAFLSLASVTGVLPRTVGLLGLGLAMIFLLFATFAMHVQPYVKRLAELEGGYEEARKKASVILNWTSIGLTAMGVALGVVTLLAFLAQVVGVELFRSLLEFFVQQYPIILTVSLLPLAAAVLVRMRVPSEEEYSSARKAVTLYASLFTFIFAFFGAFIGSGLAEGTGIEIENAVLFMAVGAITLIALVKTRALYPSVVGLIRNSIRQSEEADASVQENIKKNMLVTYVAGLLFVLGFIGYFVATSLGVAPKPSGGLGTDAAFFVYVLAGLGLMVVVLMRYFQSVNIDPRWKTKKQEDEIGKKRLSAEELNRYIVLGFSITAATLLFGIGILVSMGLITQLGPLTIAKKYGTDFFVFAILLGLGPYGMYHNREQKRIRAIDAKFPEFLRDLAESQRAGMTLTEAVLTTAKGSYGDLTPEIRKMAAQIEWGVSFGDALQRFAKRVKTPLIARTVSLIVQAEAAGGNVVDVLTAAADDSREIQMILKERRQSMSIYMMIIYIAFFVFMGVIGILNAQFIPEVAKAVSKADGVSIGGLRFRKIDEQAFKTIFFHAAIVQGFGGGLVAGVMDGGKPVSGLKHAFIMVSMAYIVFRFLIGG